MSVLRNLFTGARGLRAATNVHLAELALPTLSAAKKRMVMEQMVAMWRCSSGEKIESRIESFKRYDRLTQLNYLAVAMYYAGVPSPVPGETWSAIPTPGVNLPDRSDLLTNADWFIKKWGVKVTVKSESLDISEWWGSSSNTSSSEATDKIIVQCPSCGQKLRVKIGRNLMATCPKCEKDIDLDNVESPPKGSRDFTSEVQEAIRVRSGIDISRLPEPLRTRIYEYIESQEGQHSRRDALVEMGLVRQNSVDSLADLLILRLASETLGDQR